MSATSSYSSIHIRRSPRTYAGGRHRVRDRYRPVDSFSRENLEAIAANLRTLADDLCGVS